MTWTIETATARANAIQKHAEGLGLPDVQTKVSFKTRWPKSPMVRALVLSGTRCVWATVPSENYQAEKFYDLALEVAARPSEVSDGE